MTNHYELLYIVSIKHNEEIESIMEKINSLLKENGAEITSDDLLYKQRLAYPINQTHQGIYVAVEFDMPGLNLLKAEKKIKMTPEILRSLIIKKRIKTEAEIRREEAIQQKLLKEKEDELAATEGEAKPKPIAEAAKKDEIIDVAEKPAEPVEEKPAEAPKKEDKAKGSKVSLEDLDKKLDEILTNDIL